MDIDMQLKFYTDDADWLCFRHATVRVMKGENVKHDVDDFNDEHYLGTTICVDCNEERG